MAIDTSSYTNYVPSANPSASTDGTSAVPQKTLGEGDFLKLLVTQMTQQDPMNPMTDTNFIAQMAQFTTLQQTQNMEATMSQMNNNQQILQANSMLGRSVQLLNSDGSVASGVVDAVTIAAGTPQVEVNGQDYDLSQVLSIAPAPASPTPQP